MILASFKELDKEGNLVEEGFNQSSTVSVQFVDDKKAKKKLIGLLPGGKILSNLLEMINLEFCTNGQPLWLFRP